MAKNKSVPKTPAPVPKTRKSAARIKPPTDVPKSEPRKTKTGQHERAIGESASLLIDQRIRELEDWRGQTLSRMRKLILEADPEMTEEWKWMGTPVWSHEGNVCTGETYTNVVKLTFAQGARLPDPSNLFNASLEGNTRRAIDIREGEEIHAGAFKKLIKAAVEQNRTMARKPKSAAKTTAPVKKRPAKQADVVLLSGGNPQIPKGEGDPPVQAYIAAMPGWKRDLGRQIDALIVQNVPNVIKAVKWNSPFYGIEGQGWFLSFHVFTYYLKVTFFRGALLDPLPSGGTERSKEARWIDIRENDPFDKSQFSTWILQAAAIPGWTP